MKPTYEVIEHPEHGISIKADYGNGVIVSIPAVESNSDYQRYLRWLENPNAEEQGGLK